MKILIKTLSIVILMVAAVSCRNSSNNNLNPEPIGQAVSAPAGILNDKTDLQLNGALASQIVLENGLKVILISSPTSKFSSAAVGAQVGFSDDPIEAQGLAHFLEHMLFLGTKEFPVVGQYKQFLEANNGGSNAYTTSNHTNYYLQIRSDKFDEAVNRLSRFFVSPLFDATFVEKEKSAVHNEFNLRFEDFKPNRAFMAFTKVEGQFRGFGVGNQDTLGATTAEDTRKLFEKHYYAENMHAVLSGPQSIEDLKVLAKKYLSDIKSDPLKAKNKYDEVLKIDFAQLPARLNIKANDQTKKLEVFVPAQNPQADKISARSILGSLLGDESPESLMVVLQQNGLARSGAGAISGAAYPSGVSVTVQLSEEGSQKINEVVNYILGYIDFLQKEEIPDYFAEEGRLSSAASKIAVEYFDVTSDLTQGINRAYFSEEGEVESWKNLFTGKASPDAVASDYKTYLESLKRDKILLQVTDPRNQEIPFDFIKLGDIDKAGIDIKQIGAQRAVVDSLYSFAYEVVDVDPSQFQPKGNFVLKKPNAYIPRSFDVFKDGPSPAFSKNQGYWGEVFTTDLEDTVLPKAFMNLELMSDKVDFNQKTDAASLFLLREMLRQQSASQSYSMLTAGFEISFPIFIDKGAIGITFNGWSDTFETAFSDTLSFTKLDLSEADFNDLKFYYTDQIKLEASGDVGRIGSREMLAGVTPAYLSYEDLFKTLDQIDYGVYKDFVQRYFSGLHIRGALSGNIKATTLEGVINAVEKNWSPSWAESANWLSLYNLQTLVGSEPDQNNFLVEKTIEGTSESNALYNAFWSFGETSSVKERFVSQIMGQWLRPDYYEELRTKQQLAYSLYAVPWSFMGKTGLRLNLLSSTEDANAIELAVDGYVLKWAEEVLPQKTEDLLSSTIQNILIGRQTPVSPRSVHDFYSALMAEGYSSLEDYEAEEADILSIKLTDVTDYGAAMILNRPKSGSFVKVTKKK